MELKKIEKAFTLICNKWKKPCLMSKYWNYQKNKKVSVYIDGLLKSANFFDVH